MRKKEVVAMLLAGGQGKRLKGLTRTLAKPAVFFGGTYRIIDFPLSNCTHSGIDTVGVLTQYEPLVLHSYIGVGSDWDLDRLDGGVFVLPPHEKEDGNNWYRGTADAIYRNLHFLDQYDPEHVLILSGDHIYKMDYSRMLHYHKEKEADCTISVINVTIQEAKRFGILNADDDLKIYDFEEKPEQPKSTLSAPWVFICSNGRCCVAIYWKAQAILNPHMILARISFHCCFSMVGRCMRTRLLGTGRM